MSIRDLAAYTTIRKGEMSARIKILKEKCTHAVNNLDIIEQQADGFLEALDCDISEFRDNYLSGMQKLDELIYIVTDFNINIEKTVVDASQYAPVQDLMNKRSRQSCEPLHLLDVLSDPLPGNSCMHPKNTEKKPPKPKLPKSDMLISLSSDSDLDETFENNPKEIVAQPGVASDQPEPSMAQLEASLTRINTTLAQPRESLNDMNTTSDQAEVSLSDSNTLLIQPKEPLNQLNTNLDDQKLTLPQSDLQTVEGEESSNHKYDFEEYDHRQKFKNEADFDEMATLTDNMPLVRHKTEESLAYEGTNDLSDAPTPIHESHRDCLVKEPPDMAVDHLDYCTNDVKFTVNQNQEKHEAIKDGKSLNTHACPHNNIIPNTKDSAGLHTNEYCPYQENVSGGEIEFESKTNHCMLENVCISINEKITLENTVDDSNEYVNNTETSTSPKISTNVKDKDDDKNSYCNQANINIQNCQSTIDNSAVAEERHGLNEIASCYVDKENQTLSNNVDVKNENTNQNFDANKDSIDKECAIPESVDSLKDESKINLQVNSNGLAFTKPSEKVQVSNQLNVSSETMLAENNSTPVSCVEDKQSLPLKRQMRAIKGVKPRSQEMIAQSNLQRFGSMFGTHNIPPHPNLPPGGNTYPPYIHNMQVPPHPRYVPDMSFYGYNMQPLLPNMSYFDPSMSPFGHGTQQFAPNMPPGGPVMQHSHPNIAPYPHGPYVPHSFPGNPMFNTVPHMQHNPTNTGRAMPWSMPHFDQSIRPLQPYKNNKQVQNFQGPDVSQQPISTQVNLKFVQASNESNKSILNNANKTTALNGEKQPEEIKSIKEEKRNNDTSENLNMADTVCKNNQMHLNASSAKLNSSGKCAVGQSADIRKTKEEITEKVEDSNLPSPTPTPPSRRKDDDGIPLPAQTVLECDRRYVCLLTYVGDPTSFYIITDAADRLNDMHAEMWEHYASHARPVSRAQLQRVTYAACLDHAQALWLRCLVVDAESKDEVSVFAVDLGFEASCDVAAMQPLPPKFRVHPPSARCCHLAGIDIKPEHFEEARQLIKEYEGKALYMEVEDNSWESLEVRLTPLEGGEELGSVLVRRGYAVSQSQLEPAHSHLEPAQTQLEPAHSQLEPFHSQHDPAQTHDEPAHSQPARSQSQLGHAHSQLEPTQSPLPPAQNPLRPGCVGKYTPPHLRPKYMNRAKLRLKAAQDRARPGSSSELSGVKGKPDDRPDDKPDDDEDLEEEYDDPLMAVQGYRNRDEADVCRLYRGPPATTCFKGARCKKRHVLLHPDGWTMDRVSVLVRGPQAVLPAPGATVSVRVVHVANYNVVYAHILDNEKGGPGSGSCGGIPRTLGELVRAMNTEVAAGALRPLRQLPAAGELVAALYPPDRRFYRATVLELDGAQDAIEVMYVDYGNRTWLKLNQLRILEDPTFLILPFQAVRCVLAGVVVRQVEAYGRARDQLHALVYDKTLHATVVACGHDELTVDLLDQEGFRVTEQLAAMKVITLEPFEVQRVDPAAGPVLVPA